MVKNSNFFILTPLIVPCDAPLTEIVPCDAPPYGDCSV
jgi:hypothetical protein